MTPHDLRSRILAQATELPSPTRHDERKRRWLVAAAFALVVIASVVFAHPGDRALVYLVVVLAADVAAVVAATWWLVSPGSALGRSPRTTTSSAIGAAAILVSGAVLATTAADGWSEALVDPLRHGTCFGLDVAVSTFLFAVVALGLRPVDPVAPRRTGAAIGVQVGVWASLLMALFCPVDALGHVLVMHVSPVALLFAAGALLGERLFGVRWLSR